MHRLRINSSVAETMPPHADGTSEKNIRIAFILNLLFTVAEFAGGLYLNSLAITADALHDLPFPRLARSLDVSSIRDRIS